MTMAVTEKRIKIPPAFKGLSAQGKRYKVYYGGRGSGKSWAAAKTLLALGFARPLRILCAREFQRSISDSVHKLLTEQLNEMGLGGFYEVTRDAIRGVNGTEFIFKGLRANPQEIKSMEGVDICWVEEAQAVSAESWDILIPTIRKENSEIWITFNPLDETDPTFQRFVKNVPDNAIVRKVNYDENPYFPDVLRAEMEWLKKRDYESYLHVWEGEVRRISNALVFGGRFTVEDFETPGNARFYHGADWGFACLVGDTIIPTDKGFKLLKDIEAGDMVMTREGYKKVLHKQSRGIKKVYGVDCGYDIIATGDHRIFTADGWKQVEDLGRTEKLCMMKSSLMAKFIRGILTGNTPTTSIGSTEGIQSNTQYFTGIYGNSIMERFLMAVTYIILMAIRLITALKTFYVLQKANIKRFITKISWGAYLLKRCKNIEQKMGTQKRTGMNAEKNLSPQRRNGGGFAWSVESLLSLPMYIKNSVRRNAGSTKTQETVKKSTLANVAEKFLLHLLTKLEKPALVNVPINLQSQGEQEVFDITVENGEYFANGVLVHNCDPTTLIRCFVEGRKLYIDREAWGIGVEIDQTPALFDSVETARKWPIKADCARPETISYMRRQGFNVTAAKKWQGSVEDGIEFLKTFDIVVHPRCKHMIDEFNRYSYKQDKQTGDILPIIVDADNHLCDSLRYAMDGLIKGRGMMNINPKAVARAGRFLRR